MKKIFLLSILSLFLISLMGCSGISIHEGRAETPQQDFPHEPRGF
ncbi:hypothetical protein [Cetobacterium sp. 8H]|nr:hypothetical protein [Cetobacterium sp. 8H]